jgi:hypothetical protein
LLNINKLTLNMRHTGNLRGFMLTKQTIEAGIPVQPIHLEPGFANRLNVFPQRSMIAASAYLPKLQPH